MKMKNKVDFETALFSVLDFLNDYKYVITMGYYAILEILVCILIPNKLFCGYVSLIVSVFILATLLFL